MPLTTRLLTLLVLFAPRAVFAFDWPLSVTSSEVHERSFWAPTAGVSFYGAPSVYGGVIWGDLTAAANNEKGELIRFDLEAGVTEGRAMLGSGFLLVERLASSKALEAYAAYVRLGVLRPWRISDLDDTKTYLGTELVVQGVGFSKSYFGFTDFVPLALSFGVFRPWRSSGDPEPRIALSYGL